MVQGRNEAKVIQDITRLIIPSAESLATRGVQHLKHVIESVNEGWNNSIPVTGTRPQPDYSVGFKREAFTDDQLEKLSPFVGDFITGDLSFMATYYMYFPLLACKVKCGAAALDVADLQNVHSMTVAARAVVELHRQILSFCLARPPASPDLRLLPGDQWQGHKILPLSNPHIRLYRIGRQGEVDSVPFCEECVRPVDASALQEDMLGYRPAAVSIRL